MELLINNAPHSLLKVERNGEDDFFFVQTKELKSVVLTINEFGEEALFLLQEKKTILHISEVYADEKCSTTRENKKVIF
jgi:hypothetical protein